MVINKFTKNYDINPEYPSVDWFGIPDGENGFIPREDVFVIDESTLEGFELSQKIIEYSPYIELIIENDQLIDVELSVSLEALRGRKIEELSKICTAEIFAGFESTAYDGITVRHYDCEMTDQSRIAGLVSIAQLVLAGLSTEKLKWKATGELECYEWSPQSILMLGLDLKKHIEEKTDKFYELRKRVLNANSKSEIEAITWE